MENTQNDMNMIDNSSNNNKTTGLITIVAGIAVLGALVWWMYQTPAQTPPQQAGVSPTATPDAEAAAINNDVDSLNVGDLNAEFNAIDADIQGL